MTLMLVLKEAEKWNGRRRVTRVVIAGSLVSSSIRLASV
jgi:hypothetical protein